VLIDFAYVSDGVGASFSLSKAVTNYKEIKPDAFQGNRSECVCKA
jgi:hypothetical protein